MALSSRGFMRSTAAMMAILLSCVSAGVCRSESCPPDTIVGYEFTTPAATKSVSYTIVLESGSYDLVAGTLAGSFKSAVDGSATLVIAGDEYTVVGLPEGTPVSLTAELTGQASSTGGASHGMSIYRPGGPAASSSGLSSWSGTLSLPLTALADQPFRLTYRLWGSVYTIGVGSRVTESAEFRFTGLPPGASIVSCQGYHQDATPTLAKTWGSVKARYR